jgi:23S rRNA (adenine-N6)-dimethyltransferase
MLSNSQNFINNSGLVLKCLESVDLPENELILEIGGGKGIITDEIIKRFLNTIVIEYDNGLYNKLREKYSKNDKIRITNEDFLKYKLPEIGFSIISNIPFNITADILRKITGENSKLNSAYMIMQKDAGLKFVAITKGQETSLLSNIFQTDFHIKYLFDIERKNFTPSPNTDACFVLFKRKIDSDFKNQNDKDQFKDFICYLFDRSRPILADALADILQRKTANLVLQKLRINGNQRIKTVQYGDWLSLFNGLDKNNLKMVKTFSGAYKRLLNKHSGLQKINRTRKY